MAGVNACLSVLQSDLLVVLAVDLPQMTAHFLSTMLTRCSASCGLVARHGDFFEPLAAIYPKEMSSLAADFLEQGRHAMQDLVREAMNDGLLQAYALEEDEIPLFRNLNSQNDL